MKRLFVLSVYLAASAIACGDDDAGGDPDGAPTTSDAAAEADGAASDASGSADCTPARPHEPGETTYQLTSGKVKRSYLVYVPRGYNPTQALPVVMDFHGSGSNPAQELAIGEMKAAADAENFVVVLPVAAVPIPPPDPPPDPPPPPGFTWNVPVDPELVDDVLFTSDVITDVSSKLCVDAKRVYATGYSGGGRLTSLLACTLSDRIAAIGTVGGLRFTEGCKQERPVPIITFHGTADVVNPYKGGGPPYWGDSVEQALSDWNVQLGCDGKLTTTEVSKNVDNLSYAGCDDNSELVLYRVTDGGHTWPGTAFPFPPEPFGTVTQEIDATDLQVEFFANHELP